MANQFRFVNFQICIFVNCSQQANTRILLTMILENFRFRGKFQSFYQVPKRTEPLSQAFLNRMQARFLFSELPNLLAVPDIFQQPNSAFPFSIQWFHAAEPHVRPADGCCTAVWRPIRWATQGEGLSILWVSSISKPHLSVVEIHQWFQPEVLLRSRQFLRGQEALHSPLPLLPSGMFVKILRQQFLLIISRLHLLKILDRMMCPWTSGQFKIPHSKQDCICVNCRCHNLLQIGLCSDYFLGLEPEVQWRFRPRSCSRGRERSRFVHSSAGLHHLRHRVWVRSGHSGKVWGFFFF